MWLGIAAVIISILLIKYTENILRTMKIDQNIDRYVLITGCTSGFGYMLTKRLDLSGFYVFAGCLTDSGLKLISEQCSSHVVPIKMDVTSDDSIGKALKEIKKSLPNRRGLWALVNNAGILGGIGPGLWQIRQDYDTTMSVNVHGMAMVTNAFISLVKQENGRVINMSSIMGRFSFGPLPYAVSKYGVEAFSDGLRRELYWTGVKVCIIEPGNFATALLDKESYRKRLKKKAEHWPRYLIEEVPADSFDKVVSGFSAYVDMFASSDTKQVVDAYFHAIISRYPKKRYLVGFDAKYIFRPLWILPDWLSDRIAACWTTQ